jgi:hypothetical protein
MDKENVVYIHTMALYSAIKNEMVSVNGKHIELEIIMLSEVSQSHQDKCCSFLSFVEA